MLIVYRYTYDSVVDKYVYTDEYTCQSDPNNTDAVFIPKNSTELKPDLSNSSKIIYFEDDQWKYMDDFRKMKMYDKKSGLLEDNYMITSKNLHLYTSETPKYTYSIYDEENGKWIANIDKYKDELIYHLKQHLYEKYKIEFIEVTLKDKSTIKIKADQSEIHNILKLINSLSILNETKDNKIKQINFRLFDKSFRKLDLDDLKRIHAELFKLEQDYLAEEWKLTDEIKNLNTWEEIKSIYEKHSKEVYNNDLKDLAMYERAIKKEKLKELEEANKKPKSLKIAKRF